MYVFRFQLTQQLAFSGAVCGLFSPFSLKLSERMQNAAAACEAIWLTEDVVKDVTSCPFGRHGGKTSQTVSSSRPQLATHCCKLYVRTSFMPPTVKKNER